MPRGQKQCPKCQGIIGARSSACNLCGHILSPLKAKTKEVKPFFKERKEFIKRMLDGEKSEDMRLDMMVVTKVFEWFNNDLDFLSKVKPPFKLKGSIKYLRTKDGKDYLIKKYREFQYKPENHEVFVEEKAKVGEDIVKPKIKSLREFLNERKN